MKLQQVKEGKLYRHYKCIQLNNVAIQKVCELNHLSPLFGSTSQKMKRKTSIKVPVNEKLDSTKGSCVFTENLHNKLSQEFLKSYRLSLKFQTHILLCLSLYIL